jgi:glyoxylase-like metal-dependent hydrolase (beta-lactamase superfamily II)
VDDQHVVVDPSLPSPILKARFSERTAVLPESVQGVFLTSLTEEHLRGLAAFPQATWWAFETELDAAKQAVRDDLDMARGNPKDGGVEPLEAMLTLLDRMRAAPEEVLPGVDLFPSAGVTPGCCGLLLSESTRTTLIAGDAVATREHLEAAQVLPTCWDRERAQESFKDVIEIADVIVPGRDDLLLNPTRW